MQTSAISLALSLLFGVGQVLIGGGFAWYGATRQRWRRPRAFIPALAGAWFFCSGLVELFVSGMESLERMTGTPTAAMFALWRSRADTVLLIWTIGLALLGVLYLAANWRLVFRRT